MKYNDTELFFIPDHSWEKTLSRKISYDPGQVSDKELPDTLGISLRLGNKPIVHRLRDLTGTKNISAEHIKKTDDDYYLVIHSISAMRLQGKARVEELQYFASAAIPSAIQTVDLIPKTRFNEVVAANVNATAALDLSGQMSLDIPEAVMTNLLAELIDVAPGITLQLSSSARFVGKLSYNIHIPVVQASGVGSDSCCWVLRPDEKNTPLLGDQLLIQSIAVPSGTKTITYDISGLAKADKGIFWKQKQLKTPTFTIEIDLQNKL